MPFIKVLLINGETLFEDDFHPDVRVGHIVDRAAVVKGMSCHKLINGNMTLLASATVEASGLIEGNSITAVFIPLILRVVAYKHGGAFAAIKHDGTVFTWGDMHEGGNSAAVREQLIDFSAKRRRLD